MKNKLLFIIILFLVPFMVQSQETISKVDTIVFKEIDTTKLIMKVIYPSYFDKSKTYPGMVFFFGGGWIGGSILHFERQANYFAERGIICFLADYRVKSRQGTTIAESVIDAKSAIRYIRENAERLNIDSGKIIAAGGSSGGQLASATAVLSGYNDPDDNLAISSIPNALVLFNPAIDLGPASSVYERDNLGESYKELSPLHNIKKGAPPTIFFLGTKDEFIPVETAKYYKLIMEKVGSRCDLFLYEGQEHGFFNFSVSEEYFKKTVYEADKFLISLGYLHNEPTILNDD